MVMAAGALATMSTLTSADPRQELHDSRVAGGGDRVNLDLGVDLVGLTSVSTYERSLCPPPCRDPLLP